MGVSQLRIVADRGSLFGELQGLLPGLPAREDRWMSTGIMLVTVSFIRKPRGAQERMLQVRISRMSR
jgi:hypothetical protein